MLTMNSPYIDSQLMIAPESTGILNGLAFSVKDVMAVTGHITGLGNPTWTATHQPAKSNAIAITKLLNNGATLDGITVSDEFMFSIKGSNYHYGDPLNPKHPDCFTGGSSSGSASAVSSGLVDFALGTDTGGSVRVPASYCGIYGFRPSHDLSMLAGIAPLATSFDTVGVLTKSSSILKKVGQVLYSGNVRLDLKKIYYLDNSITQSLGAEYQQELGRIGKSLGIQKTRFQPVNFSLDLLYNAFKRIQGFQAWSNYGKWISKHPQDIGPDIADHFAFAKVVKSDIGLKEAIETKTKFAKLLNGLLTNQAILILPTTSSTAPNKNEDFKKIERLRAQTQKLTTIAGMAGTPQVAIPISQSGKDYSISIISGVNTDRSLLSLATKLKGGMLNDE
ncbi:hypothetical protein FD12_GL002134 [Lentilactobacillus rapi DSM 19907 = JCM 15042]|uniref:Amidase n=2 Tax=Lentilactobacillus rapi TaxID=481723 RepID=A0A512PPC9_9LACO|nr:amidase family protein [Lentilactobacillus rapi]KRL17052.1 hypothetical protein FD12_GL002134 [Lentilactobacillus rapi DSM 19907 = JCM 15042]GEP73066.1 amidase [Lentilactobacillus rapi]